ncbi:hypothetical protein TorRG33x02_181830 [Trema orientale]|uniref:Transmembrane protein n=1 Tax=Trema orientale TaxID=63057 RepID=A0A2P5EK87_TREOI|nr:hypothetical protein TorRG33x02_181830 [Trema orientale]
MVPHQQQEQHSLRLAHNYNNNNLFRFFIIVFFFFSSICISHVDALNIGVQAIDASVSAGKSCSRKCESDFCSADALGKFLVMALMHVV